MEYLQTLRRKIEEQLQIWEVPGVFVGAWQDGKTLLCEGFGRRNESGDACDGQTLFQIGSCTKAFTAAAAMILKERGILDLDKPVCEYLPGFDLMDEYAARHVTTRDLLCHRSGIPRHEYAWYGTDFTRAQLVHNLRYLAPNMGLRQGYQYNNIGFILVGLLIEKLTGKSWEAFVEEELFRPIGMHRTTAFVDDAIADGNYTQPYSRPDLYAESGVKAIPFYRMPEVEDYQKRIGAPFGPAGSVLSCAEDMLKWGQFHLSDGTTADGKRILSAESMKEMHRAHVIIQGEELPDGRQLPCYCLGWRTFSYHGRMVITHSGGIDGATTQFYIIPDEKLVVIANVNIYLNLMCNAVAMDIIDHVLGVESDQFAFQLAEQKASLQADADAARRFVPAKVEGTVPTHAPEDYAGTYQCPGYNDITVKLEDGKLSFGFIREVIPMSHYHYDVFRLDAAFSEVPAGITVRFDYGASGKIDRLYVPLCFEPGVEPICFRKKD